jgi:hypothetical protein
MTATHEAIAQAERVRTLEGRVAQLCGRINALEGELAGVIAALFALNAHEGPGLRTPAHYVAWITGAARTHASALATTAQAAHRFPTVIGRLERGEISLDQTAAIVRTAPDWADEVMAEAAGAMTPAQLAKTARIHHEAHLATQAAQSPATSPPVPEVHESLQFHGHPAGGYQGRLRLDTDHGAEFEAALRSHLDILWNEWKAAGGRGPSPRPIDAFLRMMRRAADADAAGTTSVADYRRHTVVLHVDVATRVGQAHMGPALPSWVTEAWSCDATFHMLFTKEGTPLGVGPSRTLPLRLRRAIEQRDGGCRVPGCGSRIVHLHHIQHHAHGGPSETWNLVGICPSHHRAIHRGELKLTGFNADDPHGLTFTTAGGRVLNGPQPALVPDAAQREADHDPTDGVVARRPHGGRVDWRYVEPCPPDAPVARHGDRGNSDDASANSDSMSA